MSKKYQRARVKKKPWWLYILAFLLLATVGAGVGAYLAKPDLFRGLIFWQSKAPQKTTTSSSAKKRKSGGSRSTKGLSKRLAIDFDQSRQSQRGDESTIDRCGCD